MADGANTTTEGIGVLRTPVQPLLTLTGLAAQPPLPGIGVPPLLDGPLPLWLGALLFTGGPRILKKTGDEILTYRYVKPWVQQFLN